ncbi:MAG: CPBP family intramembrane metalloprotease [Spirochaetes bacterium]|nr:CPBP family intramembrane metalloprotease [Spirochaetota bacterium]
MKDNINTRSVLLRLLFISLPLLLNDFYLQLIPEDSVKLNIILDLIIYTGWQTSVIYFAYKAGWFTFTDLGISLKNLKKQVLYGIVLLIIILVLIIALTLIFGVLKNKFNMNISSIWYFPVPKWHPLAVFLYVFYLSFTAGIYEEIIYRGIVIRQLRFATSNKFLLIFGSAVLFTLIHWSMGLSTWIEAFVYGILWAFLFLKYRSLIPIMTAHFLYDFLTIYQVHEKIIRFF